MYKTFIKKSLISALLILNFSQIKIMSMQDGHAIEWQDECSICAENYANPRTLLCGHKFCANCISDWQKHSAMNECPMCRRKIAYLEDIQCGLCNMNFCQTSQIAKLKCHYAHVYHAQCLKNHLLNDYKNNNCPACNQQFRIADYFPELLEINHIRDSERSKDVDDLKEECRPIRVSKIIKQEKVACLADYNFSENLKAQKLIKNRSGLTAKTKTINLIKSACSDIAFTFSLGLIANRVINNKNIRTREKPIILGMLGILFAKYNNKINMNIVERKEYPKLAAAASTCGFVIGYNITKFI